MEHTHHRQLRQRFRDALVDKDVRVLDVPHDFHFMDEELVELLLGSCTPILEALLDARAPESP